MSVFLERQKVRKRKAIGKWFRLVERILFSVAIILGGVALLYGLYLLVFLGPVFSVREINIEGKIVRSTLQSVIDSSGVKEGENLFGINVEKVHENLKANPWISHAAVRRRLPHTIWIYVDEYDPAAVVGTKEGLSFVDHEGTIFKKVEGTDPKSLPVITGIAPEKIKEALSLLSLYEGSSFGQNWGISELHFDNAKGYSIVTEKGPVEILLGQDAYASRLDLLSRWQGVIGRKGGRITYIIANEEKRITVGYRETTNS
jgi:cell division septal protein FtsQ